MSQWLRANGQSSWHRVTLVALEDAATRHRLQAVCGEWLAVTVGWEEAEDDLVSLRDRHRLCAQRTIREAYWLERVREQPKGRNFVQSVLLLVKSIAPQLDRPHLHIGDGKPKGTLAWVLGAKNLDVEIGATGGTPAAGAAELLATLETLPRSDAHSDLLN